MRNLKEAERQITIRQAGLKVAKRTYEVEQSRFELGLTQSQDLLDAQSQLTQSRIDELGAIVDYQRRLKDLRLATMADLNAFASEVD
ncbi:MAG: TolC family protein [Candidatus Latescibacterota bacterium]